MRGGGWRGGFSERAKDSDRAVRAIRELSRKTKAMAFWFCESLCFEADT
jgi:hypothetical protein